MKLSILLVLIASGLSLSVFAQRKPNNSVCLQSIPAGVVLNICTHEHGMTGMPQPRLYVRVYTDGRAEYEQNGGSDTLVKKQFRIGADAMREIVSLGTSEGFQKAQDKYPAYMMGNDSSIETTITFYDKLVAKKIVLLNFFSADRKIRPKYPAALFDLMERLGELRAQSAGIVPYVPAINYCEMIKNRAMYVGKKISVYADLKRAMVTSYTDPGPQRYGEYLYDSECENADVTGIRGKGATGIGFGVEGKAADGLREKIRRLADDRFGPRARVWATGILREEPGDDVYVYRYRFDIEEFKSFEQLVLPFKGALEQTWVYSDTFDYNADEWVIKLSQPFKRSNDYPVRVQWKNEKDFSAALKKSGHKSIIFRVILRSNDRKGDGFENVYFCEILDLK